MNEHTDIETALDAFARQCAQGNRNAATALAFYLAISLSHGAPLPSETAARMLGIPEPESAF